MRLESPRGAQQWRLLVSSSVNIETGDGLQLAGPDQATLSFRRPTSCLESDAYRVTKVGPKFILSAL